MPEHMIDLGLNFDNSYAEQLEGFYVQVKGDEAPAPKLLYLNRSLADSLGFDLDKLPADQLAAVLSGGITVKGGSSIAQAYAGHQFGHFNPQLGDGRALLLGEVIDKNRNRQDIQLKGSGATPFSRGGDGKAALAPVLREYVIGEAMHLLNIPTTRALAAVATGEEVMRGEPLPGAVLARIASSHIRIGTFQFFANRKEGDKVTQLADYAIARHYPEVQTADNPYLEFLRAVAKRQALLIAKWMSIGFVHGVMNTDNVTISGETIDYGPCAFIDKYDPTAVFSSIDHQGRYAFASQADIGQWNMARLAEALLPLIDVDSEEAVRLASKTLDDFAEHYRESWLALMRAKLGLSTCEENDPVIISELFDLMEAQSIDFTLLFRGLADVLQENKSGLLNLFLEAAPFERWLATWSERLARETLPDEERIALMNGVNPLYIPRNHIVEEALQAAEKEANYAPIEKLMDVLSDPYTAREGLEEYALPPSADLAPYKTFCGT